jgi:hypothetical protein
MIGGGCASDAIDQLNPSVPLLPVSRVENDDVVVIIREHRRASSSSLALSMP